MPIENPCKIQHAEIGIVLQLSNIWFGVFVVCFFFFNLKTWSFPVSACFLQCLVVSSVEVPPELKCHRWDPKGMRWLSCQGLLQECSGQQSYEACHQEMSKMTLHCNIFRDWSVFPLGELLVHPIHSVVWTQATVFNPCTLCTERQGWVFDESIL